MAVEFGSSRCPRCGQTLLGTCFEVCAVCYQRLGHAQRRAQVAPPPVEREEWPEQSELSDRIEKFLSDPERP